MLVCRSGCGVGVSVRRVRGGGCGCVVSVFGWWRAYVWVSEVRMLIGCGVMVSPVVILVVGNVDREVVVWKNVKVGWCWKWRGSAWMILAR